MSYQAGFGVGFFLHKKAGLLLMTLYENNVLCRGKFLFTLFWFFVHIQGGVRLC